VESGAGQAKLIDTDQIVFDPRSHLKCRFGCNRWVRKFWACPPHLDISPEMFMHAFSKYNKAILIRTTDPRMAQEVAVAIERSYDCLRLEISFCHGSLRAM
jgi:predicted metal-binding protein